MALLRLAAPLLGASLMAVVGAELGGSGFPMPEEQAIRTTLEEATPPGELDRRAAAALAEDDVEGARAYVELGDELDRPVAAPLRDAVAAAEGTLASIARGTMGFGRGFVTGSTGTPAELVGALGADFTVIGDLRDAIGEGSKMAMGEDYDGLVLSLSAIGIGATAAVVATGGGGLPAKAAVSLLKLAARAGALTADFARVLRRAAGVAIANSRIASILADAPRSGLRATREALAAEARVLAGGDLGRALAALGLLSERVGTADTLRLMKHVRSVEDAEDLAAMSARFGKTTRPVVELTGKTRLKAFARTVRVAEKLLEHLVAFVLWLGSLLFTLAARGAEWTGRGAAKLVRRRELRRRAAREDALLIARAQALLAAAERERPMPARRLRRAGGRSA